jgi:predicted PurR-regulated permease PerM
MKDMNGPTPSPLRRAEGAGSYEGSAGLTLAVGVIVVAALHFGREIFVPLALAILLSFALTPPVRWVRHLGLGRTPSVLVVAFLAFVVIFAFGAIVASRVAELAERLPLYQQNIEAKIDSLKKAPPGGRLIERASSMLRDLNKKFSRPDEKVDEGTQRSPATPEPEPIPVQVRQPEPAPLEILQRAIGPMIEPLTTGGIVIVVVIFMLLQREDLRDRVVQLAGSGDVPRTVAMLDDAMRRVAHYLLMQLVVNVTYAIPVGIGLWIIGVPNPLLWGMLALVLRFVPYIGPIIAAAFPLAVAIAVDPGWSMLLWTAILFIVLEIVSNNVVEPWLYGSGTGLSPIAIIVAAIFWTWLWGPIGLILSIPLTVCLVVLGRHVPQLAFIDILLGDEPVLTQEERLYQSLLGGDPNEAAERAEESFSERSLAEFYDKVAIPALALAERDRARGTLDDERRALVAENAIILVDDLSEHEDAVRPGSDGASSEDRHNEAEGSVAQAPPINTIKSPSHGRDCRVLCFAGRGNLDEAAAAMLAQLIERCGVGARIEPAEAVHTANLLKLDTGGVEMACVSYLNEASVAHARYLVRRLRRKMPVTPIIVGFWTAALDDAAREKLLAKTKADFLATSLHEAVEHICRHVDADPSGQSLAEERNSVHPR